MKTKIKPLFIVVDGGDGSGKSTQAKFIAKYYKRKGKQVRIRTHPALDNFFGKSSKKALEAEGKKAHILAGLFYILDVIRSRIKYYRHQEEVVIFVRYLLGVCYVPTKFMNIAYNIFAKILPMTPYLFFIDVYPREALKRIQTRGGNLEMFENIEKLGKIRKKMLLITSDKKWYIIDGNKSPQKVFNQIKKHLPDY